jgi:AraC-like DNA-binding protein
MSPQSPTPHIAEGFPGQRMVVLPKPLVARALLQELPIGLAPSDIGFFPKAKWHYFERPSGSPELILILCVQGKGWARFHRREYPVMPGHLLVIGPRQPHAYGADLHQPWSIYWCHAAGPLAARFAKDVLEEMPAPVLEVGDYPRLVTLFTEMLDELERGYGPDRLVPSSTALSHLLGLVWKCRRARSDERIDSALRVRQIAEQLCQVPEQSVTVGGLAAMANLSVSHFCALFKRAAGFAPIDYLLHMRIRRACQLLDTTDHPIKRIAADMGFSDPLYFSRVFRKVHGLSPKAYRAISKG